MSHNRSIKLFAAVALLLILVLLPSAAWGQAPQGPTNPFHTEFDVTNHPSQFDEIAMLIEVAPSASNATVRYGGDQFVTVIQGEVTIAGQVYQAGKNYVEKAGESVTISNAGTTNARLISTILLPKGAALTSDAQTSAIEKVIYKAQREFLTPPATFKVVQDVLDFAPDAGVPIHSHGGNVLGLVIQGQMTNHNGNAVTKINTGEGFLEDTNQVHSIGNESTAPAAFFGTIILPPGGEALTIQGAPPSTQTPMTLSANATVFATGLNNPRGLKFGPDGYLYVAEGGTGGTITTTVKQCTQVPGPIGPYSGGFTSRISKFSPDGVRSTVADNLPSSQTTPDSGGLVSGVADVAFINETLYGMEAGAGCSHGLNGTDNTLFRVNNDGTTTTIANLSAFTKANPVANPDPDDLEPDGTWFGMVAVHGAFYVTEPNHQELDRVTLDGKVTRVVDMSTKFVAPGNWQGPTGIAYHGNFYIGTLGPFPVTPGTQSAYKITPSGNIKAAVSGLSTVMDTAFDESGNLYALETDTVAGFPGPSAAGSGMVVRVNDDGTLTTIASGLVFPTAMTLGPDGALYVSNFGFGVPPAGLGQIVRVTVPSDDH